MVNSECEVTSFSISYDDHTFIIKSALLTVINIEESSFTDIAVTGDLCSYKVVISLPVGLQV